MEIRVWDTYLSIRISNNSSDLIDKIITVLDKYNMTLNKESITKSSFTRHIFEKMTFEKENRSKILFDFLNLIDIKDKNNVEPDKELLKLICREVFN